MKKTIDIGDLVTWKPVRGKQSKQLGIVVDLGYHEEIELDGAWIYWNETKYTSWSPVWQIKKLS